MDDSARSFYTNEKDLYSQLSALNVCVLYTLHNETINVLCLYAVYLHIEIMTRIQVIYNIKLPFTIWLLLYLGKIPSVYEPRTILW